MLTVSIIEDNKMLELENIFMHSILDNYNIDTDIIENSYNNCYQTDYDNNLFNDTNITTCINAEKIPEYYMNKNIWIKKTSLLCTSCGRSIKDIPLTIIIKKIKNPVTIMNEEITLIPNFPTNNKNNNTNTNKNKNNVSHSMEIIGKTRGLFCSIPCIGHYLNFIKKEKFVNMWEVKTLTLQFIKDVTGNDLIDIPISIDYIKLASRSGPSGYTDEEFDNLNKRKIIMYTRNG